MLQMHFSFKWSNKETKFPLFALIILANFLTIAGLIILKFNFFHSSINFLPLDCLVYTQSSYSVSIGSTVSLYCNLTGEQVNAFTWQKYNGSIATPLNLGLTLYANNPARYSILTTTYNSTILVNSILTITNVTSDDFTLFQCAASTNSYINLTQLITSKKQYF